jgi:hypothetical protein
MLEIIGCHTWINFRLKYTREQLLEFAKHEIEYKQCHQRKSGYTWELAEKYEAGDEETIRELIEDYLDREYIGQIGMGTCIVSKRTGLASHHFSDMFRVYGYPEDECHSLRETLDFLATTQRAGKTIGEDENTMLTLEKFWRDYPTGMITFG